MTKKEVLQRAKDGKVKRKYATYFMNCWEKENESLETLDYVRFEGKHYGVAVTYCHTDLPYDFQTKMLIL